MSTVDEFLPQVEMDELFAEALARFPTAEQRQHPRERVFHFATVRAMAEDGRTLPAAMTVAVMDRSESGVRFFHTSPVGSKRITITVDDPKGRATSLEAEIVWTREVELGYDSGCRLIGPVGQ